MTLAELNMVPRYRAEDELIQVCGSRAWVRGITGRRPFGNLDRLLRAASEVWWSLDETDWREGFDVHPKIGAGATSAGSGGGQIRAAGGRWLDNGLGSSKSVVFCKVRLYLHGVGERQKPRGDAGHFAIGPGQSS